jgi:hypothetical protein
MSDADKNVAREKLVAEIEEYNVNNASKDS